MKKIFLQDITGFLKTGFTLAGNLESTFVNNVKPIDEANEFSLSWISSLTKDFSRLLSVTKANILICDSKMGAEEIEKYAKVFILVDNPRLVFLRIVREFFEKKYIPGIHPTSFIHQEAKVHSSVFIGPFTYVGKSSIEENSIIHGHCFIYDDVSIGKSVTIQAGTVIGSDGFGYEKNEQNEFEKFPHVGGVVIEPNVEIGSNSCIDKGTLGNTIIKRGAKIDNLVHIAHNVTVGENAMVIANAMVGGSTSIGDNTWIAPSVTLRDKIAIGKNSTIGLGAVVTKDVPENSVWLGNPAKTIDEFKQLQEKLNKL